MFLNEEQIQGLKHGIEQGFRNENFEISDRERLIIDLTIRTTLDFLKEASKNV